MPRVYLESYGCQMNRLDNELILGGLMKDGYVATETAADADVILMNTCAVREHAEERVFSNAGKLKTLARKKPDLIIGVIGCMAQNHQQRVIDRLPHVKLVCGPRQFGAIPRLVREIRASGAPRVACEEQDEEFLLPNHVEASRETPFQAYVKVMEGCDMSCTFCIVPRVRGSEISRPPEEIVDEVRHLVDEGVVEVTLLGQTVNSYGKGLKPRTDLADLLARLNDVEGLRRIRFITSHPSFVRRNLIEAINLPKVCKYLHFPAQSGSNEVLKRMRRGYTREKYLALVAELRAEVPGIELASDFIVGFPGESDADFDATVSLIEEVRFQQCYIFKYSPRPETDAAEMTDDVPEATKKMRNTRLLDVQQRISEEKYRAMVGRDVEVLVEGPSKNDPRRLVGRTDDHKIVVFEGEPKLRGTFAKRSIKSATATTLYA